MSRLWPASCRRIAQTICACPGDFAFVDHGDADAGNAQLAHPLFESHRTAEVFLQGYPRQQPGFDLTNSSIDSRVVRGGTC
ncbi:MAG: hypothetical protein ACREXP_09525, partial [Steroidobacteraceae bacterium]